MNDKTAAPLPATRLPAASPKRSAPRVPARRAGGALLASALAAAGGQAHAQAQPPAGTVQLYGVVDAAAAWTSKGWRVIDGGNAASRFGVRGREDLGGGLAAAFAIESGLSVDTGTFAILNGWGRQAWVGIEAGWGSLRMGRQYTPMFSAIFAIDPFQLNNVYGPINLYMSAEGAGNGFAPYRGRNDNVLRYQSPSWSGLSFSLAWAPDEVRAKSSDMLGFNAIWQTSRATLVYAWQSKAGTSTVAARDGATTAYHALGAMVPVGDVKLSALWHHASSELAGTRDITVATVGALWQVRGTPWTLIAQYAQRDLADSDADSDAFSIGVDYALTRRTALYGRTLVLGNDGRAGVSLGGVTAAAGSGEDIRGAAIGIRHVF